MPDVHALKIQHQHLVAVREQRKRAEIRFNDRGYKEGDYLNMRDETGAQELVQVTHVVDLANVAGKEVAPGWVALSIQAADEPRNSVDGYSTCPFCGDEVALVSLGKFKLSWHRTDSASLACRDNQRALMTRADVHPWVYDARMLR